MNIISNKYWWQTLLTKKRFVEALVYQYEKLG